MGEQVIVLTELTKQYGKFTAVDHIRLNVRTVPESQLLF